MRSSPIALVLVVLGALGCTRAEATSAPAPSSSAAAKGPASAPLVLAPGVRFVKPGPGDVAAVVRAERARAAADGRELIVYVGASWCEPCQRFHQAAARGELDAEFPQLTILEFDLDADRDRVFAAGYESKLIPLFVAPRADGRASERRVEGGVKGDRAVANITPRLRTLLGQ